MAQNTTVLITPGQQPDTPGHSPACPECASQATPGTDTPSCTNTFTVQFTVHGHVIHRTHATCPTCHTTFVIDPTPNPIRDAHVLSIIERESPDSQPEDVDYQREMARISSFLSTVSLASSSVPPSYTSREEEDPAMEALVEEMEMREEERSQRVLEEASDRWDCLPQGT